MNSRVFISVIVVGLLAVSLFVGVTNASDIIVNLEGGGDYSTIQEAIDNATAGDTIYIEAGTFNLTSALIVNKTLTIIANGTVIINGPGSDHAIYVSADHVYISGVTVTNAECVYGIYVTADYCSIVNNTLSLCDDGIYLDESENCNIINNTVSNCYDDGIYLYFSENCSVYNNTISGCENLGISLYESDNCSVVNNTISDCACGIFMHYCSHCVVVDNAMINCSMYVYSYYLSDLLSCTLENNTVNGKPLYYVTSETSGTITDAGQVILVNCNGITISGLNTHNLTVGVSILFSGNITVLDCSILSFWYGISVYFSDNLSIANNTISGSGSNGIHTYESDNLSIANNTMSECYYGIYMLSYSKNSSLVDNTISDCGYDGIWVDSTENITIADNTISECTFNGIYVTSIDSTIINNTMSGCLYGILAPNSRNSTFADNTISGCSYGICLNSYSNNCTIVNNTITDCVYEGIFLEGSEGTIVIDNTVSSCDDGIYLSDSEFCIIVNNTVSDCSHGISLYDSDNNTIHGNYLINNVEQAYDNDTNLWFLSGSGNYWSDYTGTDDNDDGIGDTPYSIEGGASDPYPLMDTDYPMADAGEDRTIDQGTNVIFNGSGSTDNLGVSNYTWTFTYNGSIVTLHGESPNYTFSISGIFTVTLNVTDSAGNWNISVMTVTVNDTTDPVANGGSNQVVDQGTTVIFNGSASSDNVAVTNYSWTFTYNGSVITLHGASPTYTFNVPGLYTVNLNVTDLAGNWNTSVMTITVNVLLGIGPIQDADGNILEGANVTITLGNQTYSGTTDADGIVDISLPYGSVGENITVTISMAGYDDYIMTVTVEDEGIDLSAVSMSLMESDDVLLWAAIIAIMAVGGVIAIYIWRKKSM